MNIFYRNTPLGWVELSWCSMAFNASTAAKITTRHGWKGLNWWPASTGGTWVPATVVDGPAWSTEKSPQPRCRSKTVWRCGKRQTSCWSVHAEKGWIYCPLNICLPGPLLGQVRKSQVCCCWVNFVLVALCWVVRLNSIRTTLNRSPAPSTMRCI